MPIYAVTLFYSSDTNSPTVLAQATEITEFGLFRKGVVRDLILFISKELIKQTDPENFVTVVSYHTSFLTTIHSPRG